MKKPAGGWMGSESVSGIWSCGEILFRSGCACLCVGSAIPQRQAKNKKSCSKAVSNILKCSLKQMLSQSPVEQGPGRTVTLCTSCRFSGAVSKIRRLLWWTAPVDLREVQDVKNAFQPQRTSLRTGFFTYLLRVKLRKLLCYCYYENIKNILKFLLIN